MDDERRQDGSRRRYVGDQGPVLRSNMAQGSGAATIWTIGHSTRPLGKFLALLDGYGIKAVAAFARARQAVRECAMAGTSSSTAASMPVCRSANAVAGSSAKRNNARSPRSIIPCRTSASKLMISFQ